jgi:hypothetical protein
LKITLIFHILDVRFQWQRFFALRLRVRVIYQDIFDGFDKGRVRYLVIGGIAVNLHGYVRLTMDLDVMIDLSEDNVKKLVAIMNGLGYVPRVPVNPADLVSPEKRKTWSEEKGAIVFTFVHTEKSSKQLDLFLSNPIDFRSAYARRTMRTVGGVHIPIAAIQDIIALKSTSGRPRDKEDIDHLNRLDAGRRE